MNARIRSLHRWISVFFTLAVAANFACYAVGTPPMWVTLAPLAPLALLELTGLYLLVEPWLRRAGS